MHPACPNKKQIIYKPASSDGPNSRSGKHSQTGFAQKASLVALPVAISGGASLKPKRCASATLTQQTSKNEPEHGPKNGTAWRSHFLGPHAPLSKKNKRKEDLPFYRLCRLR